MIFYFFTGPKLFQDVDLEAGCDVKVGFCEPQSLDRGPARQRREATSDAVVGRRAKLLNGFGEHHWQAGLQLPFRAVTSEPSATPKRKPSFSSETDRQTMSGGIQSPSPPRFSNRSSHRSPVGHRQPPGSPIALTT